MSTTPPLLAAEFTQWKWLDAFPGWLTFLMVLGFGGLFAWLYWREVTPAGPARRALLTGVRLAAVCGILALIANLVAATVREEVRDSWVVVMIDTSVSMTLEDRYPNRDFVRALASATDLTEAEIDNTTRLSLVKRALLREGGAVVRELAEKNRIKVYSFGKSLVPVTEIQRGAVEANAAGEGDGQAKASPLDGIGALEAKDAETALGDALDRALNETRGQRVAGVVLITDGRSNAGVRAPLPVARRLETRGVPLYTVGVGNPAEPKDIAVTDLQAAEVVIAGDRLAIKVSIQSQGFEGSDAQVELQIELDDEIVVTEPIELQGQGARQEVGVQFQPDRPGEYTLSASIEPRSGELIQDNNQLSQRLRVIDKRIKVLLIDDLPRYEFRYLKWGLTRDKNMEAHTYQVSADPLFPQDRSPGLDPLTEIPKTKEELFQYHVIVLGDVDPNDPAIESRLPLIRDFVEEGGGGLLVLAGRRFMPGAYADTPLEPLLPVEIDASDQGAWVEPRTIKHPFSPQLTLDGRRHPIMQLENTPEENPRTWEALPGLFWFYRPHAVKPTALVLATHPSAMTTRQKPVPTFALQQTGAGMTFYAASDDVWRWRAGVGDRYTYRFWGQAIRYLSTGRLLKSKRFSVTTDRAVYDLGDRIQIEAEVNDRSLQPSEEETQQVFTRDPSGEVIPVTLTRPPNQKGRYYGTHIARRVGQYKLWIAAGPTPERPEPGDELAMRIFQVQVPILEKADPKMDERVLRKMARTTGGAYLTLNELESLPEQIGSVDEVYEVSSANLAVWDDWRVLAAVIALLGVEWFLRKRWKMW